MNQQKIVKKISLINFLIITSLKEVISNDEINDDERKKIQKNIIELNKNDKLLLKTFEIKFTEKEKKNLLDLKDILI